jgi:hypothetical protein
VRFQRRVKSQRVKPADTGGEELHVSPVDTRTFNTISTLSAGAARWSL